MRISDWSSDVCSSDLLIIQLRNRIPVDGVALRLCETTCFLLQRSPFDAGEDASILRQRFDLRLDLAKWSGYLQLPLHPKTGDSFQHDIVAAVLQRLDIRDPDRKSTRLNSSP